MRKLWLYFFITVINVSSFLFAPCLDEFKNYDIPPYCISLNKYMQVNVNSDSYYFIGNAIEPNSLLQQNSLRQSRPLFVIIGTLVGDGIYFLTYPLHDNIEAYLKNKNVLWGKYSDSQPHNGVKAFCFYIGYVIFNFFTLFLCLIILDKIIFSLTGSWKNNNWLLALILMTLISNQLTRYYFFSVLQQLLNILTPLLSLYLGLLVLQKKPSIKKLTLICFGLGFLLLIYGNFLLTIPAILFAYIYQTKKTHGKISFSHILHLILLIFVFILPTLAWIAYLRSIGITFYSAEVGRFRQFIWIWDGLKDPLNSFIPSLISNSGSLLLTTGCLIVPLALLFAILIFCRPNFKKLSLSATMQAFVPGSPKLFLLIWIETFAFFWLLGYYTDRLTFSLAPLIICLGALILNRQIINKRSTIFLILLMVAFHLYNILAIPIYFSKSLYFR